MLNESAVALGDRPETPTFFRGIGFTRETVDRIGVASGIACIVIACFVLLGWLTESRVLVQVAPGFAPMQPNTAVGFLLTGIGLAALGLGNRSLAPLAGSALALLAGLTIVEMALDLDLGIDRLLVADPFVTDRTASPGRMSPLTAMCFSLTAVSILIAQVRGLLSIILLTPACLATAIAGSVLAAYTFSENPTSLLGLQGEMSIYTAIAFAVAGLGSVSMAAGRTTVTVRQSAFLPLCVGLAATIVSVAAWMSLEAQATRNLAASLDRESQVIVADIVEAVEGRVRALERRADRWEYSRGLTTREAWMIDAGHYASDTPGTDIIARADDKFQVVWSVPPVSDGAVSSGRNQLWHAMLDEARQRRNWVLTPGNDLFSTEGWLFVAVPTFVDDEFDGLAITATDLASMLENTLRGYDERGIGIRVTEGNREIFRNRAPLDARLDLGLSRTLDVRSLNWKLDMWPHRELVAAVRSNLPAATAVLGLLLSVTLTVVTYLWQISSSRIRDLEAAQRDLRRAAKLEDANKELEAFSYSVSHDLRAPLRAMSGFSNALIEDYGSELDPPARDYLVRIVAASKRMDTLIDDLLALSRISRQSLERQSVDLSEIAYSIVADLRDADAERNVSVDIDPGLAVQADPTKTRILLRNLIGNAWKFTSKVGHARIVVGKKVVDGATVFFVRDNGAGFDMTYAEKLFAPFQRLHTEVQFPGTGIGLATVSRVVAQHGGRVWADAEVDQGATFSFTFGESAINPENGTRPSEITT